MAIVYPHIAFLRYLKNEERETEISHMQLDMVLMGILIALVCFNPVIALPYLIANSSANFALRGMKQVVQGLVLVFVPALLIGILRGNEVILKTDVTELIAPFLYLTVVTHYMGYLAYIRGISLIRRKKKAEEIAQIDFLTGLNNRRSMFEKIKINDTNSKPTDPDTTLIMVDLDHFKQVNDTHGHDHGDAVLVQVSEIIKDSLRGTDIVARWGGEEFLVLLPKTNIERGTTVAETIRKNIAEHSINYDGVEHKVTSTLGIASYNTHSNFEETIQRADKALYEGKDQGRNRVVTIDEVTTSKLSLAV